MSNPVLERIAKGVAAHGFNQLLIVIVQLVSLPLFTRCWGTDRYGEWIALSSLTGYLNVADLSFGATAGNTMTMLAGAGKETEAQTVYRSVWVLVLGLSVIAFVAAAGLALLLPFDRWLDLRHFGHTEAVLTLVFLIGQVVLSQQGAVLSAAFRAGGHYPAGVWANDLLRFIEFLVLVAIVMSGDGPVVLTGVTLVLRAVNYLVQYAYVRRLVPWLSLGFQGATREAIRPLVGPALAFNALPLAQATSLQGTIVVIQKIVGPTPVVAFQATRTVTRIVLQGVTVLSNAAWPEFSRALGAGEMEVARRLHRRACQASFWTAILGCIVVGALGPFLYRHWVPDAPFYPEVFAILLLDVVVGCLWTVSYVVPVSINRHQRITLVYFGAALVGLVASVLFGLAFGLPGIALGLLPCDLIMVAVVLPMSMRLLEDDGGYLPLIRFPLRWLIAKLRSLIRP